VGASREGVAPRIVLEGLRKTYRDGPDTVPALETISLALAPGELLAIIGPSGCGKTTLLNLVAGFTEPSTGRVLVDGRPVDGPGSERPMISQGHGLFPWKTARQNVEFGLKARGLLPAARRPLAQRYLDLVELTGFEDTLPYRLSGGMRQRVALTRALVLQPACLLMDEPFAALDTQLRWTMQDELLRILVTERPTVLFVTHDVDEALYLSDRVVVLSRRPGRIRRIVDVALPRLRQREHRLTAEFQVLKAAVLAELEPATVPPPAAGPLPARGGRSSGRTSP
jgi:ABC-type nitrate/sulfonate/bicarbonate transport system ATPase subunit